jgi:hypothetical protein
MQSFSSAVSWLATLALAVALAVSLLLALPSGAPALIAAHAALLVGGSAIVLALRPADDDAK